MTIVVTRHDFRKNSAKYMKMAETETIIIVRNKMADWDTALIMIPYAEYLKRLNMPPSVVK